MDDFNEELGTRNETPKELMQRRGSIIMFYVTRIRSLGDKKVVRYNKDGAPIGENGAKLKFFIGSATHYHVPITYTSWKSVPAKLKDKIFTTVEVAFVIDPRSRKNVLQTTEHNGHVRGVGGYVTPTTYFHSIKKTSKDEANILVENEELRRPIMLEGIEEKGKRIEVESLDKPKENERKGRRW
ncbi:putative serine/threonine-protein kinase nek2 [Cucumis melo var. makuwa]|uniref:Serine/threonine-protein kinase nek2 n=1 Tax=Cucumis melo var. makuwa TaxID=1194695 RepID=A0A5D3E0X5_CUCMM|nr:putative serine/threonine-protein kinase nek2 [Cucumis melo var. makuwa]TYK29747.1 putative serine/threonine-protein kinase nek2 [Cucumis melo var. makuwa]